MTITAEESTEQIYNALIKVFKDAKVPERSTMCYWERPEWIVTTSMACHWCHATARWRGCVTSMHR